MTISKKLSLIVTLGLSLNTFNASAYDVVRLKEEIQLITTFANKHNEVKYNGQNINLGLWLKSKIKCTWITTDYKIIEIANIIKKRDTNKLLAMMEKEIKRDTTFINMLTGLIEELMYPMLEFESE
jgi:hypothetical protein